MTTYIQNQKPLRSTPFLELPLGAIEPRGWIRNQLEIQAEGFTGKLGDHWDDVGPNSGWLGGTGESWERGPYYLDGLLPLAYLLKDEALMNKVRPWVEWTLNSQQENGQFGPVTNDDWWSRVVMLKVLIQYEEVSGDERVIPFMKKYFHYQREHIEAQPLQEWAEARGGEHLLCLQWLYNRTGENWLLELSDVIRKQTIDWTKIYTQFPFWRYQTKFDHRVHVVNVAMSLKYPALYYVQTGDESDFSASSKGIASLMNYHGQVHGMFSGDEWLAGTHPSQGVELCAVVEYMYTLENLVRIYGEGRYGDILEKVAFNALPATISPDWRGHQYDQQVNQAVCSIAHRNWTQNADDSNIFGLEPNFGCCTANMHQGWPKFVSKLWMATEDEGLAVVSYAPCHVKAVVADSVETSIEVDSLYPFNEKIVMSVEPVKKVTFPIKLRIPQWCSNPVIKVNGQLAGAVEAVNGYVAITREWDKGDRIELELPMEIQFEHRAHNAVGVNRGPLVYALAVEESWIKRGGNDMFPNMEVFPASAWNYGIALNVNNPNESFRVESAPMTKQPFLAKAAPIKLIAKGRRIPEWTLETNSAGTPPIGPVISHEPEEMIELVPYGSAKLRIGEIPIIKTP
ncbi:beta-L-arabinofuranosidase domain-containing protein [Neobacillus jeddahensis]|uniref:beta-L-arabinofuranosidase domain-containing protein n=1 Tax=Neobacillus jeddahensis TaxID=1461580 RepID=UPI000AE1AE0D|nr:beta-L-arabinofuranosidase domain-containing protein [Neobacillus jeddahensis]